MKQEEIVETSAGGLHYHFPKTESERYKREITIVGTVHSISLGSDDPNENIDFLTTRAINVLNQLKQEEK